MRVRNTTTVSTDDLREIIRFVCPPGIHGFDVRLNNAKGYPFAGAAYPEGSGCHDRACAFVVLRIGPETLFPRPPRPPAPARAGYLPTPWFASRTEVLVYLTAHELRHLWQAKVKRGRRVWGARGQFSERDADAYALRMLRKWRQRATEPHP